MKLDRNITTPRRGKYALIKMREVEARIHARPIADALELLHSNRILDYGDTEQTDFFVIRLKDKFASKALRAYAEAASDYHPEYSNEVHKLADQSEAMESRMPD
jgi:hypothetical protein